jgi:hypothetical protein
MNEIKHFKVKVRFACSNHCALKDEVTAEPNESRHRVDSPAVLPRGTGPRNWVRQLLFSLPYYALLKACIQYYDIKTDRCM